jgi:hypothetical protein
MRRDRPWVHTLQAFAVAVVTTESCCQHICRRTSSSHRHRTTSSGVEPYLPQRQDLQAGGGAYPGFSITRPASWLVACRRANLRGLWCGVVVGGSVSPCRPAGERVETARKKSRPVALERADREMLTALVRTGSHPAQRVRRARILLELDENDPGRSGRHQGVDVAPLGCPSQDPPSQGWPVREVHRRGSGLRSPGDRARSANPADPTTPQPLNVRTTAGQQDRPTTPQCRRP